MKPNHRELPPPWHLIAKLPGGVDVWWLDGDDVLHSMAYVRWSEAKDDWVYYFPQSERLNSQISSENFFTPHPLLKDVPAFIDTYYKLRS